MILARLRIKSLSFAMAVVPFLMVFMLLNTLILRITEILGISRGFDLALI